MRGGGLRRRQAAHRGAPLARSARDNAASDGGEAKSGAAEGQHEEPPLTEGDAVVAKYNRAVLLFHLRQYRSTLSILRALMRNPGGMDERVAMRVAFLTLEVLMHAHRGRHVGDPVRPASPRPALAASSPGSGTGLDLGASLPPAQALQRACAECDRVLAFLEAPHSFNGGKGAPPSSASAEEKEAHSAAVVRTLPAVPAPRPHHRVMGAPAGRVSLPRAPLRRQSGPAARQREGEQEGDQVRV